MKKLFVMGILAIGVTALFSPWAAAGCGSCSADAGAESSDAAEAQDDHEHTVEAGCGMCIYDKEGVKGCKTAVKVHGKVYMLKGGNINAHKDGLCQGTKQAKVVGHVQGDEFVASSAELE